MLDWTDPTSPPPGAVSAVVVDLDSLAWTPPQAVGAISAFGTLGSTPVLLITIYPYAPDGLAAGDRVAYLQPPFGPDEFVIRVRSLLDRQPANL